jgi:predicted CXXCH cytochrome family protein
VKKSIIAAVLMLSVAALANAAGTNPAGTVVGSAHDLSTAGSAGGQICVFCHTPHNAGDPALPLWSRATPSTVYTPYNNVDFSQVVAGAPGAVSLACLSCHDGSLAVGYVANGAFASTDAVTGNLTPTAKGSADAILGTVGSGSIALGDAMNIGQAGDLTKTHPIGITYPVADTVNFKLPSTFAKNAKLFAGGTKVECASCHEPHNQGAAEPHFFLRSTNNGSALCITCHNK